MLQGSATVAAQARQLRRSMSPPEIVLWSALRRRPHGFKFRRQHPSGRFIADFYCHEVRLVVEVDGGYHDNASAGQRDLARDAWFAERGIRTLRVRAADVLRDPDGVTLGVIAAAMERRQSIVEDGD